jgi:hypothetical protein
VSAPLSEQQLAEVRTAAVRAVERHPSTTFMAPCESLADAVLDAVLPALLARVTEMERLRASATGAHRRIEEVLDYLAEKDAVQLSEDAGVMGFHIVAVLDGPGPTAAERAEQRAKAAQQQADYAEAVATVARLEQKRVELERIANAERERVAELERQAAADVTVYRASHDSIVIGHYTTAAAAREHCEAYVQREHPGAVLDWIADEDDELSPAELAEQVGDEESLTGYVVTPVTVAAAYDPDGDE